MRRSSARCTRSPSGRWRFPVPRSPRTFSVNGSSCATSCRRPASRSNERRRAAPRRSPPPLGDSAQRKGGRSMIAAAACTLLAGFLIGATTLGGLIVVPALAEFAHMDIDRAVASSSAAMAAPSLLAAAIAWRDTEQRRNVLMVMAGSAAGAAAGAAMLAFVPASITIGLIALLALVGGLRGLASDRWHARDDQPVSRTAVVVLSIVAGVLSAITGTGGPV